MGNNNTYIRENYHPVRLISCINAVNLQKDTSFDHGDDTKGHKDIKIWLDNWNMTKCVCDASLAYSSFLIIVPISMMLYRYIKHKQDYYKFWKFYLLITMELYNVLLFIDYGFDLGFNPWLWYLV